VPDLAGHSPCGRGPAQKIMDDLSQRSSGRAFNGMPTSCSGDELLEADDVKRTCTRLASDQQPRDGCGFRSTEETA
jgi:hypothetical protein